MSSNLMYGRERPATTPIGSVDGTTVTHLHVKESSSFPSLERARGPNHEGVERARAARGSGDQALGGLSSVGRQQACPNAQHFTVPVQRD